MTTPPIAYVHMQRTGGNSLRVAIQKAYADHWFGLKTNVQVTPKMLTGLSPDVRIIFGHMPWGIHRLLPVRYATVLRDPIERAISHFRLYQLQMVQKQGWPAPPDFDEFLESEGASNLQTRTLAGIDAGLPLPADAWEVAASHLEDFETVGLFDDLEAFARRLGVGWIPHIQNLGPRHSPTDAQTGRLVELNRQDLSLHDWALARRART